MPALSTAQRWSLVGSALGAVLSLSGGGLELYLAAWDSSHLAEPPRRVTSKQIAAEPRLHGEHVELVDAAPAYHLAVLEYDGPREREGQPPRSPHQEIARIAVPLVDTTHPGFDQLVALARTHGPLDSLPPGVRVPHYRLHPVVLHIDSPGTAADLPRAFGDVRSVRGRVDRHLRTAAHVPGAGPYPPDQLGRLISLDDDVYRFDRLSAGLGIFLVVCAALMAVNAWRRRQRWLGGTVPAAPPAGEGS